MATIKVMHEYQTSAKSFDQGLARQGFYPPGVYKGFDGIGDAGGEGLNIIINHSETGLIKVNEDAEETELTGVVVTPQGKVIHFEGSLDPLPISSNPGPSGGTRKDLVVLQHYHSAVIGGVVPQILVIEGTPGGGVPELSNPPIQVALGILTVPVDAVFATLSWQKPDIPGFNNGGGDAMYLSEVQQSQATKAMYKTGTCSYNALTQVLHLNPDGNTFFLNFGTGGTIINEIEDEGFPNGTVVNLFGNTSPSLHHRIQIAPYEGENIANRLYGGHTMTLLKSSDNWYIIGHSNTVQRQLNSFTDSQEDFNESINIALDNLDNDVNDLQEDMDNIQEEIDSMEPQSVPLIGLTWLVYSGTWETDLAQSRWHLTRIGRNTYLFNFYIIGTLSGTSNAGGVHLEIDSILVTEMEGNPYNIQTQTSAVSAIKDGDTISSWCSAASNRLTLFSSNMASGEYEFKGQLIFFAEPA